jgi:hypothetical protein
MLLRFHLSRVQTELDILPYLFLLRRGYGISKLEIRIVLLHQMHDKFFIAPQNNNKQKQ